jgi:hypothetical protein
MPAVSGWYNLAAKYAHFNQKLFEGQLPTVPVVWRRIPGHAGRMTAWIEGGRQVPHLIEISDAFKQTEDQLDRTVLHEMVHCWLAVQGKFSSEHDEHFQEACRIISQKFGAPVDQPVSTKDVEVIEEADKVDTGFIIRKRWYGDFQTILVPYEEMAAELEPLKQMLHGLVANKGEIAWMIRAHSFLHYKYPFAETLFAHKLLPQELERIFSEGRVLAEISP